MTTEMNWLLFVEDSLTDAGVDYKTAKKYAPKLADSIRDSVADLVSDFIADELHQLEEDAKAAAEDAYWEAKIDEHQEEK